jgi:hypothetical protein
MRLHLGEQRRQTGLRVLAGDRDALRERTGQLLFGISDHVDGEHGRIGHRCDGHHGDRALLVGEHPDHRHA